MKPKVLALILLALVVIGAGMIFLRSPQPNIVLAPETIFTLGPVDVTNTMITAWIITAFLLIVSLLATRNMKTIPDGIQNVVEAAVEAFYGIVRNVAGDRKAAIFLPVAGTIFFFIALSNWAGLLPVFGAIGKFESAEHVLEHELDIEEEGEVELVKFAEGGVKLIGLNADTVEVEFLPGEATFDDVDGEQVTVPLAEEADAHEKAVAIEHGLEEAGYEPSELGHLLPVFRSVNTDLMVPLAMALVAFFFIEFWAFRELGFGYLGKFFSLKGGPIGLFVGVLEFFGEFIRVISLTFRLFGNTVAGEVLLIMVVFLAPLLVVQVFYGLELLFAVIQAFIFSILTVVFASMAMESHHGEHQVDEPPLARHDTPPPHGGEVKSV